MEPAFEQEHNFKDKCVPDAGSETFRRVKKRDERRGWLVSLLAVSSFCTCAKKAVAGRGCTTLFVGATLLAVMLHARKKTDDRYILVILNYKFSLSLSSYCHDALTAIIDGLSEDLSDLKSRAHSARTGGIRLAGKIYRSTRLRLNSTRGYADSE